MAATDNESTKNAVSVIAVRRFCATGAAKTASTMTTAKMTAATVARLQQQQQQKRRQFVRTSRMMSWQRNWLAARFLLVVLAAVIMGTHLITRSSAYAQAVATEPSLRTYPRSTLPDSPMTTQNDLITTAQNSTASLNANKPKTAVEVETTTTVTGYGSMALGMSSTAPTITKTTTNTTTEAATKSTQIGLTKQPTTSAKTQTAAATTTRTTMTMAAKFISTIYPTSTVTTTATRTQLATTPVPTLTETDASNSIEMAMSVHEMKQKELEQEEQQEMVEVLQHAHPENTDSLTKGFSIPTFLPPFPVFAAADLPAYRAAAAAAEAAAIAAAAAAAEAAIAAASTLPPETTVTLSPEQQRQQIFNEQHSYLAYHNGEELLPGQKPRRNLTMPVLNITAQMGNHAYMPCQIHRLSDKPVSWVRLRDGHIISVDETTFIGDERFQSIYQEDGDYIWSLQIKYVEASDEGWYECQMATEPKLSAKVHLVVITPKTELIGDQTRFVKAGSKVAIHCIVRGTLDPPKYIIWFRGQKKISENDERRGWYTQLDRNIFGTVGDNQNTIGSLIIPFVRKEDSGNYTCQPSNSVSVYVDLHVLSGEYSASAIMSGVPKRTQRSTFLLLLLLMVLVLWQHQLWPGAKGMAGGWGLLVSKT